GEQQLRDEGGRDHCQRRQEQRAQHPPAGEPQRDHRVRVGHRLTGGRRPAQWATVPVALDGDRTVRAPPHDPTPARSASSSSVTRAAPTVTLIPRPVSSRANSRTWSVSLNGEVNVIVNSPAWEIAQNCGRAADTWNRMRRTRASAGSGRLTRPRLDTATVRLRLFARFSRPSRKSLTGRGTTRSAGDRSNRISRRNFFPSAHRV